MKELNFYALHDFIDFLDDEYNEVIDEDEYNSVYVIGFYKDVKRVVEELIRFGYPIANIELADEISNGYANEYFVSISFDGIWCEPMKRENGYLNSDGVHYIFDNCNSAVLSHCSGTSYQVHVENMDDEFGDEIYDEEFLYDDEYDLEDVECGCNCKKCHCEKDELDKDLEELEKLIRKFLW